MKILKNGDPEHAEIFRQARLSVGPDKMPFCLIGQKFKCPECHCVFEFQKEDIEKVQLGTDGYRGQWAHFFHKMNCPSCLSEVKVRNQYTNGDETC